MFLRKRAASAVRDSASVGVTAPIGALNLKAAGGIEPPMNPCQESALATWLRRPTKNKEPASRFTDRLLLALCLFAFIESIIALLRWAVNIILDSSCKYRKKAIIYVSMDVLLLPIRVWLR